MTNPGNRALILNVALDLFAARGYDATGVQEIVEAAGITKPTLYHYFGSKRGLLETLLDEQATPFLDDLRAAATYTRDLTYTLNQVVAVYLRLAAEKPRFCRFLLSLLLVPAENEAYPAAAHIFEKQRALLESMFEAAALRHGNMRGRHRRYTYSLLGVLNGYALLVLQGQLVPDDRLRRDIVQQFSHGIYS